MFPGQRECRTDGCVRRFERRSDEIRATEAAGEAADVVGREGRIRPETDGETILAGGIDEGDAGPGRAGATDEHIGRESDLGEGRHGDRGEHVVPDGEDAVDGDAEPARGKRKVEAFPPGLGQKG